jgi:hypothetical protein
LQKTCKDGMTSLLNERFHSQEKWNLLRVSKITHGLTPQAAPKINEQSPQFPFTPVKNSKCFTCNSFQDYQTKRVTYNICSNWTPLSHKIHANQETDDPSSKSLYKPAMPIPPCSYSENHNSQRGS